MELLKYTIAVILGGALTFVSNYILEYRRLNNEKFKYRLDKMISAGEEYYKLSTYSLIYFTSLLDTIDKREDYMSEGGHHYLNNIDKENQKLIDKIRENNITITTASLYFKVSDSEIAVSNMLRVKEANVKQFHFWSIQDIDQYEKANREYIEAISSIIDQIKADQLIISDKIKKILT